MNRLISNWNVIRIVRLLLGLGIIAWAVIANEYVFVILGALLAIQALLNASCCCAGGCGTGNDAKQDVYKNQIKKFNLKK
ncbi:MAG: hypothetical protein PHR45_05680 [Muribaculaceae bacterium]|nr:hypothetical protein [Muribaculaceae bacterium]